MRKKVLYITGSLPSLTSTFIYREILALERNGVQIDIVSMNRPSIDEISEDAAHFLDRTLYLDKTGIIHCTIGKLDFTVEALQQNLAALMADLKKAKPAAVKGTYLKKLFVSSTMGPGLAIEINSVFES